MLTHNALRLTSINLAKININEFNTYLFKTVITSHQTMIYQCLHQLLKEHLV